MNESSNQNIQNTIFSIVGLVFVCLVIYAAYLFVKVILGAIAVMDSDIAVAIIAASATLFVSIISIVVGKVYESQYLVRQENRKKKIPAYESLLKFFSEILKGTKKDQEISEDKIIEWAFDFNQQIMIWGSDEVIASWIEFRKVSVKPSLQQKPMELMLAYEEVIRVIRRDLGHKTKRLRKGDILRVFINEPNTD